MRAPSSLRRILVFALASASVSHARSASAQGSGDSDPRVEAADGLQQESPYWNAGKVRPFVAATFDLGGIFARTELDAGYGKPHHAWGGVEAYTKITTGGVSFYAGPRITIPHFQLRAGVRGYNSTDTHWLVPRQEYDRVHLDLRPSSLALWRPRGRALGERASGRR